MPALRNIVQYVVVNMLMVNLLPLLSYRDFELPVQYADLFPCSTEWIDHGLNNMVKGYFAIIIPYIRRRHDNTDPVHKSIYASANRQDDFFYLLCQILHCL